MIRILFVIDSLGYGGAERQLVELIKGLDKHKYQVHVVALIEKPAGYADLLAPNSVNISYFCRSYKADLIGPVFQLIRYINRHHINLVHTFMNMGSLFGCLAAKATRTPVICSAIRDAKDVSSRAKYLKLLLAFLADRYVANSLAGFTNRNMRIRRHYRVIYNGIDFSRFSEPDCGTQARKRQFGLERYDNLIGMVASLSVNKDHETLLRAAPLVLKKHPRTVFLFIGDGDKRAQLEKLARSYGILEHVLFTGYRSDVDRIYPMLRLCVLLTNTNILDGIPNTLLEAMANGIPVVASAGGGTLELVKDGYNGILVPPKDPARTADAVNDLLSDGRFCKRVARRGKWHVHEFFGLEKYVGEYERNYEEVLNKIDAPMKKNRPGRF